MFHISQCIAGLLGPVNGYVLLAIMERPGFFHFVAPPSPVALKSSSLWVDLVEVSGPSPGSAIYHLYPVTLARVQVHDYMAAPNCRG